MSVLSAMLFSVPASGDLDGEGSKFWPERNPVTVNNQLTMMIGGRHFMRGRPFYKNDRGSRSLFYASGVTQTDQLASWAWRKCAKLGAPQGAPVRFVK